MYRYLSCSVYPFLSPVLDKNRRRKIFGEWDGNPLHLSVINDLCPGTKKVDLENICNGVKFLIENKSITGEIINIDSGQRLAWQTPDIIKTKE